MLDKKCIFHTRRAHQEVEVCRLTNGVNENIVCVRHNERARLLGDDFALRRIGTVQSHQEERGREGNIGAARQWGGTGQDQDLGISAGGCGQLRTWRNFWATAKPKNKFFFKPSTGKKKKKKIGVPSHCRQIIDYLHAHILRDTHPPCIRARDAPAAL